MERENLVNFGTSSMREGQCFKRFKISNLQSENLFLARKKVPAALPTAQEDKPESVVSSFKEVTLKEKLHEAIMEHRMNDPSKKQKEFINQVIYGKDVLCEAKSSMQKIETFVIATLQQLNPVEGEVTVAVICPTPDVARQISKTYLNLSKHMNSIKVGVFVGGGDQIKNLKPAFPDIVVGTPCNLHFLLARQLLNFQHVKFFVLYECDLVEDLAARHCIQKVFINTPPKKQVIILGTTLTSDMRNVCKLFMQKPVDVNLDDEQKLPFHKLQHYYIKLMDSWNEKNRKIFELLDVLEFKQVIVFVKTVQRCMVLSDILQKENFPVVVIHRAMTQEERLAKYQQFKDFYKRILITTDLIDDGIDIDEVNVVVNYDMPEDSDTYLHRVARAGYLKTKCLGITFVSNEGDAKILNEIQNQFGIKVSVLPEVVDSSLYL